MARPAPAPLACPPWTAGGGSAGRCGRGGRRLGISQEELALRIGADQAYVSRIEAGRMNVTLETAEALAAALEADVAALLATRGQGAAK